MEIGAIQSLPPAIIPRTPELFEMVHENSIN
jgi:hypothetical protein